MYTERISFVNKIIKFAKEHFQLKINWVLSIILESMAHVLKLLLA